MKKPGVFYKLKKGDSKKSRSAYFSIVGKK
jgi:hypothetical protein